MLLLLFITLHNAATKWKDASSGQHVEYDQRPDIFRFGWKYSPVFCFVLFYGGTPFHFITKRKYICEVIYHAHYFIGTFVFAS